MPQDPGHILRPDLSYYRYKKKLWDTPLTIPPPILTLGNSKELSHLGVPSACPFYLQNLQSLDNTASNNNNNKNGTIGETPRFHHPIDDAFGCLRTYSGFFEGKTFERSLASKDASTVLSGRVFRFQLLVIVVI